MVEFAFVIPRTQMSPTAPLSLYVHMPWCTRKCPYCDFNSHELRRSIDERTYVDALLTDLRQDTHLIDGRKIETIFIGGGTPSLFSGEAIANLLDGISSLVNYSEDIEVTMEANPGSSEFKKFADFRAAGVNRLSIGVQSFNNTHLKALGRIHEASDALGAVTAAKHAGFEHINLDIMYALPEQSVDEAIRDIEQAVTLFPEHLSCYQLTIEPNTLFHNQPPKLPDSALGWEIQQMVHRLLMSSGYHQYEVSAWAIPGAECKHNLNYWQFGDYLGIGAGAHGKISYQDGTIGRYWKSKQPKQYLQTVETDSRFGDSKITSPADLVFEFLLNALRLKHGFQIDLFEQRTGQNLNALQPTLGKHLKKGWLVMSEATIKCSEIGYRFLDELLAEYLPPPN